MKTIKKYEHKVAFHCESGTLRNLLKYAGLNVSEAMLFGIGTGVCFAYLKNAKGMSGFPVVAIRLPMGTIFKNIKKICGIDIFIKKFKTTEEALVNLNQLVDANQPAAVSVDMFYMKYLPPFMQVHIPLHFISIIGREGNDYAVSDPYSPHIATLNVELLKSGWATHALFANDNLIAYVKSIPANINWKQAIIKGFKTTCLNMLLPPIVSKILPVFGVAGIKYYANQIPLWPTMAEGLALREGILFNPTILEEQGTGGGAFRMLYAAFLQESAEIFNSSELKELANRMAINGEKWRDASRFVLKIGKQIPTDSRAYPDWLSKNKKTFYESLNEAKQLFIERSDDEKSIFTDLKKVTAGLKG